MKKKKFRNPLLSANPPPQCTVNPPQTTIKKNHKPTVIGNPANPQTYHHSKKTTNPANPANLANPQTASSWSPPQSPDQQSPSVRKSRVPPRRSTASSRSPPRSDQTKSLSLTDRRIGGLPLEQQISAGIDATAERWDRSDGGIGAPLRSVLRLARVGWARVGRERKRAKERKRVEKRRVAGGDRLGVARVLFKESRQWERKREQRLRMRGVKCRGLEGDARVNLENGLRKNFP